MESKVDYRFKILYAIAMFLVVSGHIHNGGVSLFYELLPPYMFHVQLFVFCSGYFYKRKAEVNPLSYVKKKISHLIIPLYMWNLVYSVIVYGLSYLGFSFIDYNLYNFFVHS